MAYNIGDQVMYRAMDANLYLSTIIERKVDYPNKWINTTNNQGNFDYLIQYIRNGAVTTEFCKEKDLTEISPDNVTL